MHEKEVKLPVHRRWYLHQYGYSGSLRSFKLFVWLHDLPRIPVFQKSLFAFFKHLGYVAATVFVEAIEALVLPNLSE